MNRFLRYFFLSLLMTPFFILAAPTQQHQARQGKHSKYKESKETKNRKPPKLTIFFITDSLPKDILDKTRPFLTGGLKFLMDNSISYENTFHPHGNCSSGQGFAAMSTGTFPSYHGIVNNLWLDANSQIFLAEQDNDLINTGVFNPTNGLIYNLDEKSPTISAYYPAGVSPNNYRVDNLSDELILYSTPEQKYEVFAISSAGPEPAALFAGRLGKGLWLDPVTGLATTCRYYYPNGLPDWVEQFNETHPLPDIFTWTPLYPIGSKAYHFPEAQNFQFSVVLAPPFFPFTVFEPHKTFFGQTTKSFFPGLGAAGYLISPDGIKKGFEFVKALIDHELNPKNNNHHLVLWFDIASFDILASFQGTQTQDSIDIVYQIDKQLELFFKSLFRKVNPKDCLFVLSSDEAAYPSIPEVLQQQGFGLANRIITESSNFEIPNTLVDQLNAALGADLVLTILPPFLYVNLPVFNLLSPAGQEEELINIRNLLRNTPGIKDAWIADELIRMPFEREDQGRFFKLQTFRNKTGGERRSGEIVFQSEAFNLFTDPQDIEPMFGNDHTSVYGYDAHVPLYIYQEGRFTNKKINTPVITPQIPITLSEILNVPRPSGASVDIHPLPELNPFK
jgi:hypothetical protein